MQKFYKNNKKNAQNAQIFLIFLNLMLKTNNKIFNLILDF